MSDLKRTLGALVLLIGSIYGLGTNYLKDKKRKDKRPNKQKNQWTKDLTNKGPNGLTT